MDQELREYLDQFSKSLGLRFEAVDGRFDSMERRFEGRFESMEGRFGSIERQLQEFREETAQNFAQVEGRLDTVETRLRHTQVVVEDLRGTIQLVAEGVDTTNGRLDRLEQKVDRGFEEERATRTLHEGDLERRLRVVEKPKD